MKIPRGRQNTHVAWMTDFLGRIVRMIDAHGVVEEFGFAYGTLPGHVLSGEERFEVRWDRRGGSVWYDLRAQAMFEDAFRDDVAAIDKSLENMVWRIATRFAELGGKRPAISPASLYALFDGLFQKALLMHLSGNPSAIAAMRDEVAGLLPTIA